MTGLPAPPALPPAPPPASPAIAAARAWIETAATSSGRASDVQRAVTDAGSWTGMAAMAARERAARESARLRQHAVHGLTQATAVARWAAVIVDLGRAWAVLAARRHAFVLQRARLVPVPDSAPTAQTLRCDLEAAHAALTRAVRHWHAGLDLADRTLASALRDPDEQPLVQTEDSAWRSLLALDTSAAARATRAALAKGDQPAYLLDYEPERFGGDGSVVISYGDPTAADDVAVVVPGITHDAATIADVGALAVTVARSALTARPSATTASIAWLGYDAPSGRRAGHLDLRHLDDLAGTLSPQAAEDGARDLAGFVDRLGLETRAGVTVVGHSYGSTTAALAARAGMHADRLVLLGSPGAGPGTRTAEDLHIPVWVAADDLDPVTWAGTARHHGGPGLLGADPAQDTFGAVRLPTDPTTPPHLDQPDRFVDIHLGYLHPGSVTAAAVGAVVVGTPAPTVPGRTVGGARLAARWGAGQAAYELTSWR